MKIGDDCDIEQILFCENILIKLKMKLMIEIIKKII